MADTQAPTEPPEASEHDALIQENMDLRREIDALRAQNASLLKAAPQTRQQKIAAAPAKRANAKFTAAQRFTDIQSRRVERAD